MDKMMDAKDEVMVTGEGGTVVIKDEKRAEETLSQVSYIKWACTWQH